MVRWILNCRICFDVRCVLCFVTNIVISFEYSKSLKQLGHFNVGTWKVFEPEVLDI